MMNMKYCEKELIKYLKGIEEFMEIKKEINDNDLSILITEQEAIIKKFNMDIEYWINTRQINQFIVDLLSFTLFSTTSKIINDNVFDVKGVENVLKAFRTSLEENILKAEKDFIKRINEPVNLTIMGTVVRSNSSYLKLESKHKSTTLYVPSNYVLDTVSLHKDNEYINHSVECNVFALFKNSADYKEVVTINVNEKVKSKMTENKEYLLHNETLIKDDVFKDYIKNDYNIHVTKKK